MKAYQQDCEQVLHEVSFWTDESGQSYAGQSIVARTDESVSGAWQTVKWGTPWNGLFEGELQVYRTDLGAPILVDEGEAS